MNWLPRIKKIAADFRESLHTGAHFAPELRKRLALLEKDNQLIREALARIEARQTVSASNAAEAEFRAFSQFGEDGILQYLVRKLAGIPRRFVEFGVQNYREANTRHLLTSDFWEGMVIEGDPAMADTMRRDEVVWKHGLRVVNAFITRDNIDDLIRSNGFAGPLGVLSVDIDGVDYWVWEAITAVDSAIVVTEYNARWGPERAVTVPYDASFVRGEKHHSCTYYGASLAALEKLGARKGYDLVAGNRAGNNAFFVKSTLRPADLPKLSARDVWRPPVFREGRSESDALMLESWEEEALRFSHLPIVEV
jgi:hypothetical protein